MRKGTTAPVAEVKTGPDEEELEEDDEEEEELEEEDDEEELEGAEGSPSSSELSPDLVALTCSKKDQSE